MSQSQTVPQVISSPFEQKATKVVAYHWKMKEINTKDLCAWIDATLSAQAFNDYCPNGLQVEGKSTIKHIIAGVTASEALIMHAIERRADAILVHHGWFWKGEDPRIRGQKKKRLSALLAHDINLIAYHLPLDAHPVLGNNAQLAKKLGLTPELDEKGMPKTTGSNGLLWLGSAQGMTNVGELNLKIENQLGRRPLSIGSDDMTVGKVAWCTGAAQNMLQDAIDAGANVYISGEISEPTVHLARESGVTYISAGHHATERYGIQALGNEIQRQLGIQVDFVDLDNPA